MLLNEDYEYEARRDIAYIKEKEMEEWYAIMSVQTAKVHLGREIKRSKFEGYGKVTTTIKLPRFLSQRQRRNYHIQHNNGWF